MAELNAQVSVGTSATLLVTAPSTAGPASSSYTFENAGATDCYLGSSTAVTSTTGFLLKAGAGFSTDIAPGDKVYAICASGSTTVDVWGEVPS